MLDVGWTELVVIAIVLIIVVGPKDLPPMLRTFGKMMTKMRGMAGDFRQQFDEALKEADLDDVRKTLSDAQKLNPAHSLREAMNPLRQMGNDIKADLQKATASDSKPAVTPASVPAPDISAEAVVPPEQPKVDPVASAALASAAKQLDRAATVSAATVEKPKVRRVAKPKTIAVAETAPLASAKPIENRPLENKPLAKKTAMKIGAGEKTVGPKKVAKPKIKKDEA